MAKCKPALYFALALVLLPCLPIGFPTPAAASPDAAKWTEVSIPAGGSAGNWVLASGADVQQLAIATDGSLYARVQGLTYTLYKAADGGYSWSQAGEVQDSIVDIATSPHDPDFVGYATESRVYLSTDGGDSFEPLPPSPGGAGSNNIAITSLSIAWLDRHIIIAGTRDADSAQYGGVYTLDREQVIAAWEDTAPGSYDVYAVAASPGFAADRQITAVVTDETDTYVTSKVGDMGWGATVSDARLARDNAGAPASIVASSAAIAFPRDYSADPSSGKCVQFIAVDTGTGEGDLYRVRGADAPDAPLATDLNIGAGWGSSDVDITGLAVTGRDGEATLVAGAADSTVTYLSEDGGDSWAKSRKAPSGASRTYLARDVDSGSLYAATSGDESGVSISQDNGITWKQTGLIDTTISSILDIAPSPRYASDGTVFMLTFGGEHSLWRSTDECATWERVFHSALPMVDSISLVELPPQYGPDTSVVFLAGNSGGNPAVWKSKDNGGLFARYPTLDPETGSPVPIDAWAVAGEEELFIGGYDGSNGRVYRSTNGGFTYSEGALSGSQSLHSLALSPDLEGDRAVLAGNVNGWVYYSGDHGATFQPLPSDAASAPLAGSIAVAFHPRFASNGWVYAASNTADKGVYRFNVDTGSEWERIGSSLPAGGVLNQVLIAPYGTLYAANSKAGGGMERCLNPDFSLEPTFETVTRGVDDSAKLNGLWHQDHRLWSIDTAANRLLTFVESLEESVKPVSPDDGAPGIGVISNHAVNNVNLDWEPVDGATTYRWQLDYDTDFSSVPADFEGTTRASTVRLPALDPATTYYWRVRVTAPVLSPWSEKRSFTAGLESETVALRPLTPEPGATGVPISPLFQWNAVAGAKGYELLVCASPDFASPAVVRAGEYSLDTTAWQCNVKLDHDTTYYWKVRALSPDTHSAWSAVSAFTTEPAPTPPEESATPPSHMPIKTPAPAAPSPQMLLPPTALQSRTTPTPPPTSQPPPVPPPAPAPAQAKTAPPMAPEWTGYLIGFMGLVILILLIIVLVMAVRRP